MKKLLVTALSILLAGTAFASSVSRDYFEQTEVKGIKADLRFENVLVGTTDNDEIMVEISCNNPRKMPSLELENGVLVIKNTKKATYAENCSVYIYLPVEMIPEYLEIKTISGDIEIKSIQADKFVLQTISGDMNLKTLLADNISLQSTSGDMEFKTIESSLMEIETTSGDIEGEYLNIGQLRCKSTSGEIEVEKVDCEEFELGSRSGSITIKLNQPPQQNSSINSTSGSVDIRIPKDSSFQLEISSSSGSFDDDFDGKCFRPRSVIKSKYNGGGTNIRVETVSGDISLDD